MATKGGQIEFDIGFNVNTQSLQSVKKELQSIQSLTADSIVSSKPFEEVNVELQKAKTAAASLENAFDSAFNKDLGTINVSKLNESLLKISNGSLKNLYKDLKGAGDVGTSAFNKLAREVLTTNTYIKQSNKLVNSIFDTLTKTIKWNIASSAINKMTGSIQEAWGFTKSLDSSLNNIQIVTGKSADQMAKFAVQANKAAKELGATTTTYSDAALTFYQQGLSDEDANARAKVSTKVSNVTGLSGDQSAEYVTAVLNGYKVSAEDAEAAMDKLAAVGANTASSLAELSEAMAKVASSANVMGVSEDQLAATLSTVISATRQDAATVGTAFKTIYARISDIKAGSEDAEVSLGNYTKKMAAMGFSVLDSAGNMRDLGEVMEEIGEKWQTLTKEQQISLAQTMAGTRQYNNLMALFENWSEYEDALNVSMKANGTLQQQQEIYAESYTAKLNELTAAKENLFMTFVDNDGMKDLIDGLTTVVDKISVMVKAIGGGKTVLMEFGLIAMKIFDKQIGASLTTAIQNIKGYFNKIENNQAKQVFNNMLSDIGYEGNSSVIQNMQKDYEQIENILPKLEEKQQNILLDLIKQKNEIEEEAEAWDKADKEADKYFKDLEQKWKVEGNTEKFERNSKEGKEFAVKENTKDEKIKREGAKESFNKTIKDNRTASGSVGAAQNLKSTYQKAIQDAFEGNDDIIKKFSNKIDNAFEARPQQRKEALEKIFEEIREEIDADIEAIDAKAEQTFDDNVQQKSRQGQAKGENLHQRKEDADSNFKAGKLGAENAVKAQDMMNLARSLSQVAIGISQIKQLGNIWSDEDASIGDIILGTMTSLSMIIPGLITVYNGLKTVKATVLALSVLENSSTTAQVTAEELVTAATNGDAEAKTKLITLCGTEAVAKLSVAGAAEEETKKELANTAAKEMNAKASSALGKALNTVKSGMNAVGLSAGVAAVAIAGLVAAYAIWKWNKKQEQKEREEAAQKAQAQADASYEIAKACMEENDKIHNLISSYDQLNSKYDGTAKSLKELQTETSKLLKEYGLYDEAVKAINADYDKLNEIMDEVAIKNNQKVIESSEKSMQDTSRAITAKMSADGSNSFLTYVIETSGKTRSDVDDIFEKYNIQNAADMEGILTALMEHGEKFREDLAEADESYAEALFAETDKYADLIGQGREVADAKHEAAIENIGIEKTSGKEITDIKSFDKTVEEVKQAALDAGEFLDPDEAEEWARSYVASMSEVTASIEGYKEILEKVAKDELPTNQIEIFKERAEASADDMKKLQEAAETQGIDLGEAIQKTIGEDGKFSKSEKKELADLLGVNIKDIDFDDLESSLAMLRSAWSDEFNNMEMTYEDFTNLLLTDNPLQGSWMDPDQFNEKMNKIIHQGMDDGTAQIYTLFTDEDWKEILGAKSAEEQEKLLTEKIEQHLEEFKERFRASTADSLNTNLNNLIENADYYNSSNINNDEDYLKIQENLEYLKLMYPELEKSLDIINDKEKAGTEEWLQALEQVQGKMSSISTNDSGIYKNGEGAASVNALDQAYVQEDISEDDYNSKFMATLESESDSLDLNTEAVKENAEALQDMALSSNEVADSLAKDDKAALKVAKDNARMNKGLEKLGSNFDDLSKSIKNGVDGTGEYTSALNDMKDILGDVLNIDPDIMSTKFIVDNLDLIQKAAEGDTDAIQELRVAASNDILMNVMGVSDFSSLDKDLQDEIAYVNQLAADNNFEIGASLDDTDFLNACMDIVNQAGMSAEQATAYLSSMGIDATVTPVPVSSQTTRTVTVPNITHDSDGYPVLNGSTTQTYSDTYNGTVGAVLEVSNATYTGKSGGTVNYKNKSGKKGSGKKGGGGGSSKADKKDYKDPKQDRYYEVNSALKGINNELEKLETNRENLTGVDLADSYRQELDLLNQEIGALSQKQKLQKEEAEELKTKGRTISKNGQQVQVKSLSEQGVKFNDDGTIANYNEAMVDKTNWINSLYEKYNEMAPAAQESYKATIEAAEQEYDQFLEDMDRYQTLVEDEMVETSKQIAEAMNKKIELQIEKFSMTLELKIDTRELKNTIEDFNSKMEHRDKTAAGRTQTASNKLANYADKDTGVQARLDALNKVKQDVIAMENGGHSDTYSAQNPITGKWTDNKAKAQEDLKKLTEELMKDCEDIDDLMEQINQGLLDTFDEIQEGFDEQIAGYDNVADHISHNISIIEKLYGENATDKLGEWYDAQYKNSAGKVDMLKKDADFWQKQMENAENDDAYEKAKENWIAATKELDSAVETALDDIVASYENSIDDVFNKLNDALTGGKGLNYAGEEWELMNKSAERYLDTINSTYEVQKLQRKYMDSIDNTDSISAQQKLNDLMAEEIGYLEQKDKLTQYDIDRANLKYEIALKQIALEEAQQNKSTLRLKRDSQGNYSYQYAGDTDDISAKQQELADAQNSLYNLDKNNYKSNLDDMYSIYSEFQDKMTEVAKQYGIESEEYEQYRVFYEKQYGDMINGIVAENEVAKTNLMQSAYDDLKLMYESDSASFAAMTDLNMESFDDMTDYIVNSKLPEIVNGHSTALQDMIDNIQADGGFESTMKGVWSGIAQAATLYQERVKEISTSSGEDLKDLHENTDKVKQTLDGWIQDNDKIIENADATKAAYDKAASGAKSLATELGDVKANATESVKQSKDLLVELNGASWGSLAADTALTNLINKLKEWNSTEVKAKEFKITETKETSDGTTTQTTSKSQSVVSPNNNTANQAALNIATTGLAAAASAGISATKQKYYIVSGVTNDNALKKLSNGKEKIGPYDTNNSAQQALKQEKIKDYYKTIRNKNGQVTDISNKLKVTYMKSGGYTGEWNNGSDLENGRLAVLHQKELVLNESDTENLLNTVEMLREGIDYSNISNAIVDSMKKVQSNDLQFQNKILNQLYRITDSLSTLTNEIKQDVKISASFQDVRTSQDIVQALNELTNRASQMAFNTNRNK